MNINLHSNLQKWLTSEGAVSAQGDREALLKLHGRGPDSIEHSTVLVRLSPYTRAICPTSYMLSAEAVRRCESQPPTDLRMLSPSCGDPIAPSKEPACSEPCITCHS